MLSLIQARLTSIKTASTSVQSMATQENETQHVSNEDDYAFFNEDTVTLNLTNTDSENSATVNLFQLPIGEGDLPPSDAGGSIGRLGTTVSITSAELLDATALTWNIEIVTPTPSSTVVYTGALPSPANVGADALVTGLNTNTDTTWAWKLDGGDYVFYMTDTSNNKYFQIKDKNGGANPPFKIENVFGISGSTVSIPNSEAIDYNAITSELNNGCYKLPCVNVYANDIAQANREFVSLKRKTNGFQKKKILNPAVSPMQQQFVTENVQIQFTPLAGSLLEYTLNAGESVRLIIQYSKNPACGKGNNAKNPTVGSFLPNPEMLDEQMHQCDTKPLTNTMTKPPIINPLINIINPTKPSAVDIDVDNVINVAPPILPSKPLFKPVLNDTSIVYPKPPMVSPRPIFEKPIPKPQVVNDEPMYVKPTPIPIVVVPIIVKPTIINVVDSCRNKRTNMREYMSRFKSNDSIEDIFECLENSDYREL